LRLYRQIAGQIATLIDNGEFPAGSRLPAERELASLLGVSRTSVREAIISLEIAGRVEVRVGSGIFVAGPARADCRTRRRRAEPFRAARRASPHRRRDCGAGGAHHQESRHRPAARNVVRMRQDSDDFAKRDAADREFHVRIAAATGNGSLALVTDGLWQQRRGKLWSRIETYFHTQKIREATLVDHTASSTHSSAAIPRPRAKRCTSTRARRARVPAPVGRDRPRRNGSKRRAPRDCAAEARHTAVNVSERRRTNEHATHHSAAALCAAAIALPAAAKEFRSSDVHPTTIRR
jgi:DNA-binding FadR family transcriptional regulator